VKLYIYIYILLITEHNGRVSPEISPSFRVQFKIAWSSKSSNPYTFVECCLITYSANVTYLYNGWNSVLVRRSAKFIVKCSYWTYRIFLFKPSIHIYIHTYIHTYVHTYIHTHTHNCGICQAVKRYIIYFTPELVYKLHSNGITYPVTHLFIEAVYRIRHFWQDSYSKLNICLSNIQHQLCI
jgi:hypothetical protein